MRWKKLIRLLYFITENQLHSLQVEIIFSHRPLSFIKSNCVSELGAISNKEKNYFQDFDLATTFELAIDTPYYNCNVYFGEIEYEQYAKLNKEIQEKLQEQIQVVVFMYHENNWENLKKIICEFEKPEASIILCLDELSSDKIEKLTEWSQDNECEFIFADKHGEIDWNSSRSLLEESTGWERVTEVFKTTQWQNLQKKQNPKKKLISKFKIRTFYEFFFKIEIFFKRKRRKWNINQSRATLLRK